MPEDMLRDGLMMLVIMNPFAQLPYLKDLMDRTETEEVRTEFMKSMSVMFGECLRKMCRREWGGLSCDV